jgi:L-aspartate oxidase
MARQIKNGEDVYIDVSAISEFEQRFPFISSHLKEAGIDLGASPLIPVTPGAHFCMGGVLTDEFGQTNVGQLYAVGEVANTGVHGANRLASNSLLECLVFGKRAAEHILARSGAQQAGTEQVLVPAPRASCPQEVTVPELEEFLRRTWESIGIVRNQADCLEFMRYLAQFDTQKIVPDKQLMELENMVLVAREITAAAIARPVSIGAHYIERAEDV